MSHFRALFLPGYGVSLVAVPVAATLDHLACGATPWMALVALPLWVWSTLFFALPFASAGAAVAAGIQSLAGGWLRGGLGRWLFMLVSAGVGAAVLLPLVPTLWLSGAAAGGTAGWLATAQGWPPARRRVLVVAVGLGAGLISGFLRAGQLFQGRPG